jgi:replicative DNA helicase
MEALTHLNAEKTVLGCAISNQESMHRIMPILAPSDFSLDSHRSIFRAIVELADAGKPVDELTLLDFFTSKGQLNHIGGIGYLGSLTDTLTSGLARTMNVEHYARLVLDKSKRRQVHRAMETLLRATEDVAISTEDCIQSAQEALLQVEATSEKRIARHVRDIMPGVLHELESQSSKQGLIGMPTGIHSLDLATGGIRDGELWTVGGLPGRGKTALGLQIVLANGAIGNPTYVFSLEMQELEIGKRFLAARSSLPAIQIRNPHTIKAERWHELTETTERIKEYAIYVDDRPSLKIQELLASSTLYIRRHGVKLIIVDYLRLVDAPGRDLRERVSNVANALRQLAKRERVGIVLLSQLRRPEGGLNDVPSMLDLKESGDIEAHSHVVLLPYLPIGEDGRPNPEDDLLIIGKNRNGGIGALPIFFDTKRLQFLERKST